MEPCFDHEKLRVYQEAVEFVAWADELLRRCKGRSSAKVHLDDASTSAVLNIAEGNGKFSKRERCRFLQIARGSALECAGALDVLVAKKLLTPAEIAQGKQRLHAIVNMLTGLISSVSDRVSEEEVEYGDHTSLASRAICRAEDAEESKEHEHEHEQEHEQEHEHDGDAREE